MPSPKPHLPEEFVSKLRADPMMVNFESVVFSLSFHTEARLKMVDSKDSLGPDEFLYLRLPEGTAAHPDASESFPYLHLAATLGDPLLACEMIRLGAEVDIVDRKGNTPLLLALQRLRSCQLAVQMGLQIPSRTLSHRWTPASVQRLAFIARILIEQHADVNRAVDGDTPLHYACQAQLLGNHWRIIIETWRQSLPPAGPVASLSHSFRLLTSLVSST